jgi:molybdopterin molybdotransferase
LYQHSQPLDLEEALASLKAQLLPINEVEHCALQYSRGRILAKPVTAQLSLPPFRASAMDGYAIHAEEFDQLLVIIGESLAGQPFQGDIGPGECVRIFTGALVPASADQIILQEEVAERKGSQVRFNSHNTPESYIRPIGNDLKIGSRIAGQGDLLNPFLMGSLASAGVNSVEVFRKPVIGVFSSGDELRDPGVQVEDLLEGQIYDSNRLTVIQLLANLPLEVRDLGRLADEVDVVSEALTSGAKYCDAMITSGGVSVGDADYITETIEKLGTLAFWRLNLKPGKPMAFGKIENCWIFGLPGNPVSTIVTALLLVRPALAALAGTVPEAPLRIKAKLTTSLQHQPGRTEYQRGTFTQRDDGFEVGHTGDQDSNRLSTFHNANCLIKVDNETRDLQPGDWVNILPLTDLIN